MRKLNGHLHGQCTTSQLDSNLERCRKMFFFSQWHRRLGRNNQSIPDRVKPMTFWVLDQMLHHWDTGSLLRSCSGRSHAMLPAWAGEHCVTPVQGDYWETVDSQAFQCFIKITESTIRMYRTIHSHTTKISMVTNINFLLLTISIHCQSKVYEN